MAKNRNCRCGNSHSCNGGFISILLKRWIPNLIDLQPASRVSPAYQ